MASPTVCGLSALLLQDYRARHPGSPDFRNSTLKTLLTHTAQDLGTPGPDYQTGYGSFQGLIEDRGQGYLQFYMFDRPQEVRNCSNWQCFQPRGRKGFLVHMATRPWDVSSGILTIERIITCGEGMWYWGTCEGGN